MTFCIVAGFYLAVFAACGYLLFNGLLYAVYRLDGGRLSFMSWAKACDAAHGSH